MLIKLIYEYNSCKDGLVPYIGQDMVQVKQCIQILVKDILEQQLCASANADATDMVLLNIVPSSYYTFALKT